ncbi:aryl-sulfate sulfotransferase [Flavobacterium wongokense]|uniref:aryl-sulfate sulfotransferase n=1 Tax=Flavobacterium wongokense TaxID=2910674 RepID=UPI001F3B6D49|nr:aryl-sulfate sulfotransferase [Flavobacterium sp. WG47]MCF6132392.1 aryl-sulfate sulfotransferase [Flavobacterium sp. WG47]
MKKITLFFVFIFLVQFTKAQPPTIGLLYQDTNATDGYTLFTPLKNNEVFLIDNCGENVHQWTFTEIPGATCYLLANGNLLRAGQNNLEIRDWNNNVVWTYATTANGIMQHHDIEPLPNGNIICIAADRYTQAQMTAQGRNPAITGANLKLEKIVELHPVGTNSATIVWEWKFKDHLIQDFDATKLNYGVVDQHAELLDVNYDNGNTTEFIHANGIDYNAALDQILISGRHLNEIYIIDHSTTTAQAASHSGGNSGHGGDFLWRWGNPEVYRQGTIADKKLFLQHDPKWVETGYLDEGKITVFNNGAPASAQTFTSIVMIQPEIIGGAYTKFNNRFNPATYDWSWSGSILGVTVNEDKQSGTHSLPNGNMMIGETSLGRVSEITKSGTLLWSYINPTGPIVNSNPTVYAQFSTPPLGDNGFFRAEKYPANYIGFSGHDLTHPIGIIESSNSLSAACISALGNTDFEVQNLFVLNPIRHNTIQFNKAVEADLISIFDTNGRKVYSKNAFSGDRIAIELSPAVYFMQVQQGNFIRKIKVIVSQ